jgi:hypothetical protein
MDDFIWLIMAKCQGGTFMPWLTTRLFAGLLPKA